MSNEPNQTKEPTVEELSHKILKVLEESKIEDVDTIRRAIGLTLTSVHSAMIVSAQTKETQEEAVLACFDTVDRLCGSLKKTIEECGIEGFEVINDKEFGRSH